MILKRAIPLLLTFTLLCAKFYLQNSFSPSLRSPSTLNPRLAAYESHAIKTFSIGYDNLLACLLWVDLLQNAKHTPINNDEVSWEYAGVEAITTLDPRFERAYSFGATFLSVFRRDKQGGKLLLEKWVRQNPAAWRPAYLLGVHYYLEMNDYQKAAPLILRASVMPGAPQWMSSLGIRLLSEQGALITAMKSAIEIFPAIQEKSSRIRLGMRIRSLNWNLQKQAFEESLKSDPEHYQSLKRSLSSLLDNEDLDPELIPILKEKFEFVYLPESKKVVGKDQRLQLILEKVGIYHTPN